jgi:hypothetical protein
MMSNEHRKADASFTSVLISKLALPLSMSDIVAKRMPAASANWPWVMLRNFLSCRMFDPM